jgi:hypothetical protein
MLFLEEQNNDVQVCLSSSSGASFVRSGMAILSLA